jgi:hypothetical protein
MSAATIPLSGHGAKISRAPAATPTAFTEIAEVGDITLPGLDHNEFDATSHNRNIDAYVMGVLRRDLFTIKLNFLPTHATHDHLTGLIKAAVTNPVPTDGFKITFPDLVSIWLASGQVKSVNNIVLPVDGLSSADVSIRFSGIMTINGVVVGT